MKLSVLELVELVEGQLLQGSPETVLGSFEALDKCGPDGLSFFGNERYLKQFEATKAGAVLVPPQVESGPEGTALVVVENP